MVIQIDLASGQASVGTNYEIDEEVIYLPQGQRALLRRHRYHMAKLKSEGSE